jgi:uncharacterized protein
MSGQQKLDDEEQVDFAIIMTSGSDTPKHCAAPFFFAATAAAMEMNVVIFFTAQGTLLLKNGEAEKVFPKEGGVSLKHFMDEALTNGVKFVGCKASLDLNDISEDDLAFDMPLISVAQAMPFIGEAKKLVSF